MRVNGNICLIILLGIFATATVFGQTTYTWTGAGDGTNLANSANWNPAGGPPSGATQDSGQWDGQVAGPLAITYFSGLPSTGFGTKGVNWNLTSNQAGSVTIICPTGNSGAIGFYNINVAAGAGALTLGDNTTNGNGFFNQLNLIARPAGAVHAMVNNSTNPATINPGVRWQAGGGSAYVLDFGGTGNWVINNYLRPGDGGPTTIILEGPGNLIWSASGQRDNAPTGPVIINGGTMILKGSGLVPTEIYVPVGNNTIVNNGTLLEFDAPAQSDNISRVISGTGLLQVNNGTWTFSGQNTFTGNISLSGGELIAGVVENAGTSGPLGVGGTISFTGGTLGFSAFNAFDYSSRFSTAAGQSYRIDTSGQSLTLATGLGGSGSTLTKAGAGMLTLSGTSSYSGATTISGGELVFQGTKTGSGNFSVADGAALGVNVTGTQVTPGTLALGTTADTTLEFFGVNNTDTAPLAPDILSSVGTVTVNINSGTFAVGQSYPLLSWTSGSVPAVSLGYVSGALGFLSTNGNAIKFNVTAVTFAWTGVNSGNWTDPGNWTQAGSQTTYFDPVPVQFDDAASGTTSVVVDALVHPQSVLVNNSTKTYAITSGSGNNIAGGTGLTKRGSEMLTLSGGANTYTGVTTISGGTLSVGTLANGGSASDIGAASSSAANLVLDGGTLQYSGGAASIDRLFSLGTGGGTIDASGSGALNLNNPAALGFTGNGPRMLTLAGTDTDDNTLAASLSDGSGVATRLTKNGPGKWILTGTNSYSGGTSIANGLLQIGTGGGTGSPGTGNITNNGVLDFNRTGTLTVSGAISGSGSVTNDGTGTVILAGNNTYNGGTTINAGTLQIGNGGATGSLDHNGDILNNSVLVVNTTGAFNLNSTISGTGSFTKRGSGLLKLLGTETYTGLTTIDPGGLLQICSGNQGAFGPGNIVDNGTLLFVRQDTGVFGVSGVISGFGSVTMDSNNTQPGDMTLSNNCTYTGGTIIKGGAIILGDGVTPGFGSIAGNVGFAAPGAGATARSLTFNRPDNYTFAGSIGGNNDGSVVQNGTGTVTLTGNNTYTNGTTINSGTLQVGVGGASGSIGTGDVLDFGVLAFNRSDDVTFGGAIICSGSLVKLGAGKLTLTARNSSIGTTTVSNGTLVINTDVYYSSILAAAGTLGGTGTVYGPVTLNPGATLAPGTSVGTLTINDDLSIGGNLTIEVNKSLSPSNDLVVVSGVLTNTGTGTLTVANLGPALAVGDKFKLFSQPVQNGAALTVIGAGGSWINNLAVDGSIAVIPPTLKFAQIGNNLQFTWTGSFKLQSQTNGLNTDINSWGDYPGGDTSPITVSIDVTKDTVFFRLVSAP